MNKPPEPKLEPEAFNVSEEQMLKYNVWKWSQITWPSINDPDKGDFSKTE